MPRIGTIRGDGRVTIGEKDLGPARYDIAVSDDGRFLSAEGTLTADEGVIWETYNSRDPATLILQDGERLSFLVTQSQAGSGFAYIKASGRIPGYSRPR